MAISNDLLSSTLYSIRDGEVDELFKKVPFLSHARQYGGMEFEDGGIKIQRPLSVVEHSSITQLPTGYEPVSLAVSDVLKPAIYNWSDFVAPVVITKKEEMENQGEKAIVKILEARMKSVMGLLRREINKQILAGTSTVLTTLNTLNGHTITTGFIENGAPAPASQTNTVGGLAKNTLNVRGWYNQYQTAGGAFNTNGLVRMNQIYIATNSIAPMGEVNCIIASEAAMANYKRALFANERYIDEKTLDGGRMSLAFAGAVVEQDLDMPINGGVGVDEFSMYFINFDGVKIVMHRDGDYAVSPFEHISGTTARAAQVYWKGQLIADHLGSQGVLVNGDTW
tara:strand:+ start:848 stop:1864 length:1017 start_codon:yes stop_codon:yes gene_type:complete